MDVCLHTHMHVYIVLYYANVQEKKQLQILDLGSENEGVQLYTWLIGDRNMTIEHDNVK